jgi:hypothetical protein
MAPIRLTFALILIACAFTTALVANRAYIEWRLSKSDRLARETWAKRASER